MSYRTIIADAMKARLLGNTQAGANVFTSLDRALTPDDMPAVAIYSMASRRGKDHSGNTLITRIVTLNIEAAVVSTPQTALADAEAMADEIEAAVEADPTLGTVVHDTEWQQTLTDVRSDGEVVLGVVLLEYQIEYLTARNIDAFLGPESPLPGKINVHGDVTPRGYVEPVMPARLDGPSHPSAWGGDQPVVPADITQVGAERAAPEFAAASVGDFPDWNEQ